MVTGAPKSMAQWEYDTKADQLRKVQELEEKLRRMPDPVFWLGEPDYSKPRRYESQPMEGRYVGQPKIEFVRNHGKDGYDIFVMTQRGPMKLASLDRDGIPIVDVPQPKKSAYKEGYLRTEWLMEAHERCMNSEKVIRVQLERTGLVLIGTQADDYETRVIKWETLENADHNIILDNIELLENQLDIVGKLKVVDGKRRKTARKIR